MRPDELAKEVHLKATGSDVGDPWRTVQDSATILLDFVTCRERPRKMETFGTPFRQQLQQET
jgi:hypothetical protein